MQRSPEARVVVVTGAGGGIGSSIALHLAQCGHLVLAADRDAESLAATAASALEAGTLLKPVCLDVADEAAVHDLFARAQALGGGLHGLVHCAGATRKLGLLETTSADYEDLIRVNLTGAFYCLREAGAALVEAGVGGSLIAISSINARRPLPSQAVYSATKSAIESLVVSAAVELGGHGIRVNAIAPGAVLTTMTSELVGNEKFLEKIPLGRVGTPQDLNGAVDFLLGDRSQYVTGATFVVDGGRTHYR